MKLVAFVFVVLALSGSIVVGSVFPGTSWPSADPADLGLNAGKLEDARDYALTGGGSGMIVHQGKVVMSWGDRARNYDLKSSSKSIGLTAMGLALKDGKLRWTDKAADVHPSFGVPPESNRATGWLGKITLEHLAKQTAGFEKRGGYEPLVFEPGTEWHYSDCGPNWLAECVTLAYRRDVESLLFERVFDKIGVKASDLRWRNHSYRPHRIEGLKRCEFGSGVHANVNAMARIGLLYLREGNWDGEELLPREFVRMLNKPRPGMIGLPERDKATHGNASEHYSLLWWNNADGTLQNVPRDAYWSWGLYDSMIVVIPSLDLVVARAGKSWSRKGWNSHYDVLQPFFDPIVASAAKAPKDGPRKAEVKNNGAPYPPSPMIRGIQWASKESIVRKAKGSDNWPLTWADDDALYTAYGDGWGFEPKVPEKLSLGLAKVTGDPSKPQGENIRSETAEQRGQGKHGKKASGLLMVDGTLYMWVRNAGNSQLGWSEDRGLTWAWADWKFETSFGCPTFLNFGKNDEGARDDFVYIYSQESDSAYDAADSMVLARVVKDRIRERTAYGFFAGMDPANAPKWRPEVSRRKSVFEHEGMCYRGGVTFNAGLKRYLWCQIHPDSPHEQGPRFEGGFGIYDAPNPWGPWTTVFFTRKWDVGPGETSSFPAKWMSADGRTAHLVFSGDDFFSVRKAEFLLAR